MSTRITAISVFFAACLFAFPVHAEIRKNMLEVSTTVAECMEAVEHGKILRPGMFFYKKKIFRIGFPMSTTDMWWTCSAYIIVDRRLDPSIK